MTSPIPNLLLLLLAGVLPASLLRGAAAGPQEHFANHVWPLLAEKCHACHGKDGKVKGGLDLMTEPGLRKGGENGAILSTTNEVEASPLLLSVHRTHADWEPMPPKENDALSAAQVEILRRWLADGAVWVAEGDRAKMRSAQGTQKTGVSVPMVRGLDAAWSERAYPAEDLWAFRPLKQVLLPAEVPEEQGIDWLLEQEMKRKGIPAAPAADARSFIRRATLDLTGLLPSPEEVAAYAESSRSDPAAPMKLIEWLLDSPHYGEQMARHWMDVARYADSAGFANDFDLPHAWRYRDYLVRAFNEDRSFARFIHEQIAGDEMPSGNEQSRIATTFLRMGPWEHSAMAVEAETRQQWLDDVVNIVGNAFLGMEMSCFKCHDHKFDPLPTRDYYRLQAVFAATQPAEARLPFQPQETLAAHEEARSRLQALMKQKAKRGKKPAADDNDDNNDDNAAQAPGAEPKPNFRLQRWLAAYEPVISTVHNGPRFTYISKNVAQFPPEKPGTDKPLMDTHVLLGGSIEAAGERVTPGVLSAVSGLSGGEFPETVIPDDAQGRRLALAGWLTDSRHPLTARVIVNRVWGWHFGGRPLVPTPNNFGVKGIKPTHPELLDWLARWFMEHDWSLKRLHQLIMRSAAYQRAVSPVPGATNDLAEAHRLLACYPVRRLTAEEFRDTLLQASGELNRQPGGPPARPQMNWDAATSAVNLQGGIDMPYRPGLTPAERNRRTVYALQMRSRRDPLLETFDQPASERSCPQRLQSIVVPQALTCMNGDFVNDRALALAHALHQRHAEPAAQIEAAFRLLLGRAPRAEEAALCAKHHSAQWQHHQQHPPPVANLQPVLRSVSAYDPAYLAGFVPDLQPADASASERALADVCLVLFNLSEFLYLP